MRTFAVGTRVKKKSWNVHVLLLVLIFLSKILVSCLVCTTASLSYIFPTQFHFNFVLNMSFLFKTRFLFIFLGGRGGILCLDSMPEDVRQNKFSF